MKNRKALFLILPIFFFLMVLSQIVLATPNTLTSNTSVNTTSSNNWIYAVISGPNGNITGDVTQKGYEGQIQVLSYSDAIIVSSSAATGTGASSSPTYYPFKITVAQGSESTPLIQILVTGGVIKQAVFNFYDTSATGVPQNYYRITLKNAMIVGYSSFGPSSGNFEVYSFSFATIIWNNLLTNSVVQVNV